MKEVAIFRASARTPEVSEADAKAAATAYDPKQHEAPVVIGHPASNKPAWGWVKKLDFKDGKLWATLKNVHSGFAAAVRERRYPKISASFYTPNAKANPKPGQISLRHVGFLGSVPPAVPGLPAVNFSADDKDEDALSFEFAVLDQDGDVVDLADDGGRDERAFDEFEALKNRLSKLEKQNMSDADTKKTTTGSEDVSFAEKKKELDALEAKLNARQAALDKQEEERNRQAHTDFMEKVGKEGKVLPRHLKGMIDLMCGLDEKQVINFAAADSKSGKAEDGSAVEFLQDFLNSLPQSINYAEVAKAEEERGGGKSGVKVPQGFKVSPESIDLSEKATQYAAEHKVSYAEALLQVGNH